MRIFKSILLLLFLGVVVIFVLQNLATVRLVFFSWHLELPLSVISILLYVLGAISGGLLLSMLESITKTEK